MSVDRRTLLKTTAAGAAVGGPFAGLVAMPADAHQPPDPGALVPIPDERDGAVRLWLHEGFKYRSFHDTEFPDDAHRRHRSARPARRHGRLRRARARA